MISRRAFTTGLPSLLAGLLLSRKHTSERQSRVKVVPIRIVGCYTQACALNYGDRGNEWYMRLTMDEPKRAIFRIPNNQYHWRYVGIHDTRGYEWKTFDGKLWTCLETHEISFYDAETGTQE